MAEYSRGDIAARLCRDHPAWRNNAAVVSRGSDYGPRRAGADRSYARPSARQSARELRLRRAVRAVVLLWLAALGVGCLGRSGPAAAPVPFRVAWALSPASNTVTIRVTAPPGRRDGRCWPAAGWPCRRPA